MEKIELKGLDSVLYHETLKNGLQVLLIPYENKNSYYMTYGTWFGSVNTEFVPLGEENMVKVPDGIAHFLEHKMFEQEDGVDPFTFYAESGTGANASTTFNGTQYLCYGNKNLLQNLEYLLNYVASPYFTDENVEKEKGIIAQEIKMYDDIPEWFLQDQLRRNLFHEYPMRIDIAGDVESINKITKEDLYKCYNTYYRPDNMFLIVAGKMDVEEVIELIRKTEENHCRDRQTQVKEKEYHEKEEVVKEKEEFKMNVKLPKVGYAIKLDRNQSKIKDNYEFDLYLSMVGSLLLGVTSPLREKMRNKKLTTSFYYEFDKALNYRTLMIIGETTRPEELLQDVKEELNNMSFNEDDFERIKKVWIASEVQMIDHIPNTVDNFCYEMFTYHQVISDRIARIRKMTFKEFQTMVKELNWHHRTEVIIYPKETEE